MPGLLIVGHGTSEADGQRAFWTTVRQVAEYLPDTAVEGCFLEFAQPDVAAGLRALARRGVDDVVLVPLLLFAAGHAERDIPAAARAAAQQLGLRVRHAPVLGCHPDLVALSAARFDAAAGPHYQPENVLWLFVGRGHYEPAVSAEMERFVQARLPLTRVGQVRVAYLAMARPRVEDVLATVATTHFPVVVVQPHLLYPGKLLTRLASLMAEQERRHPRQQWLITECLGCDPAVARVVAHRFNETAAP